MEISVREAKARFAEAASAAASGERVVITKRGVPFVEIVPAAARPVVDMARLEAFRSELGLAGSSADWFDAFISNPDASRKALGLDD
jgi:prevent-host-death family protein